MEAFWQALVIVAAIAMAFFIFIFGILTGVRFTLKKMEDRLEEAPQLTGRDLTEYVRKRLLPPRQDKP